MLDDKQVDILLGGGTLREWHPILDEGQRQIILLALFKLKLERPGWIYAIGEIEQQLGGQIEWPEPRSSNDG